MLRLKASLVACGYEQVFGVDYLMTFATFMQMSTVTVILDLAVTYSIPAKHGDIPNAYLKAYKQDHLNIFVNQQIMCARYSCNVAIIKSHHGITVAKSHDHCRAAIATVRQHMVLDLVELARVSKRWQVYFTLDIDQS